VAREEEGRHLLALDLLLDGVGDGGGERAEAIRGL
jgi:hypothetical protein